MAASDHFEAGPSTLPRVIACPASVKASRPFPNESTLAAEHGTRLHSFAEVCLKARKLPRDFPADGEWAVYTPEDRDAVTEAVEYVRDLLIEYPGELFTEIDLDLSVYFPGLRGSADVLIVYGRTIIVVDFKFGRVKVAASTPQLKAYALGALEWFVFQDFDDVVAAVVQPFAEHFERVEYTVPELQTWAAEVMVPALTDAFGPSPTYNPTPEACKYCRARGQCRARIEAHYAPTAALLDAVDRDLLTPDEIGAILANADKFESTLNDVKAEAIRSLIKGQTIPGAKLVEATTKRKWTDPASTPQKLYEALIAKRPEIVPTDALALVSVVSPITITAAEKLLGKTNPALAGLTVKPEGGPALAPESDPRPVFAPNSAALDALDSIEIPVNA